MRGNAALFSETGRDAQRVDRWTLRGHFEIDDGHGDLAGRTDATAPDEGSAWPSWQIQSAAARSRRHDHHHPPPRARAQAATPGPVELCGDDCDDGDCCGYVLTSGGDVIETPGPSEAALYVALRNAIPELLEALELRRRAERLTLPAATLGR